MHRKRPELRRVIGLTMAAQLTKQLKVSSVLVPSLRNEMVELGGRVDLF